MMLRLFCVILMAVTSFAGAGSLSAKELTVSIEGCPRSAKAGQALDSAFRVVVVNNGKSAVKNAAVEIVLKKSAECPSASRHASYSPNFFDGVLLRNGREYVSPDPGQTIRVIPRGENVIPLDTPAGRTYFLCALVYEGDAAKESDERVNCSCCPIRISGSEDRPVITGFAEACVTKRGTVTILGRNFGPAGEKTVVLEGNGMVLDLPAVSWGGTMIVARIPDDLRIQENTGFSISIRRSDHSEILSNSLGIAVCPERKPQPAPQQLPPVPPFFY